MVSMPMLEYRMKREERRLAKYDLKKTQLDLEKTWVQVDDDTAAGFQAIKNLRIFLCTLVVVLGITLPIDGTIKDYNDNKQIDKCEAYVTAAHMSANCANGIVGKTTNDGK
jgi:hypothetical protein